MDMADQPIHIIIRLPFARPEGYVDTQQIQWTEVMEKTLWQIIGQTKPSLVDWNAVSRQLGNVPVPFLIRHAAFLYQNQLQDLHRIGEQQDLTAQLQASSRPTSRGQVGPGAAAASLETHMARSPSSASLQHAQRDNSTSDISYAGSSQGAYRDRGLSLGARDGTSAGSTSGHSNASVQQQPEVPLTKAQASPSLSGVISTFPSSGKPASMSSSASTIRPIPPSSPSPSLRNTTASSHQAPSEGNVYNSGVLSNRGSAQPRSTRGSQLIGSSLDRRSNYMGSTLPTSPQEKPSYSEVGGKRISEPAHPFHHATISASIHLPDTTPTAFTQSPSLPVQTNVDPTTAYRSPFQDNDPSSTISSVSTPYSQSNSASQIFEETSFFNQLSSNDSLSRGHHQQQHHQQQQSEHQHDALSGHGGDYPFGQEQGGYGLGFMGDNTSSSSRYKHANRHGVDDDDDDDDNEHTDQDDEGESHDESGPLSEQIKQLHLEDVLAFLPIGGGTGGGSASGVFQRPTTTTSTTATSEEGYQRRTASGDKMPFQLDDELASLGTRALEEILENDGGDEEEGHRVRGIRFQDNVGPHRIRGLGREGALPSKLKTSPERSVANSRKSSAQNSVGSSFSDLSDSSVTQSAMEDAYLSGFNNSKISLFMHASTKN